METLDTTNTENNEDAEELPEGDALKQKTKGRYKPDVPPVTVVARLTLVKLVEAVSIGSFAARFFAQKDYDIALLSDDTVCIKKKAHIGQGSRKFTPIANVIEFDKA